MNPETFFKEFVKAVKVELADEFDRNFERKAYFNEPWPLSRSPNTKGSMMARTGALRRSQQSKIRGDGDIVFSSSLPYASIHNEGGTITVTAKMKKYFWAMYYQASGGITKKKDGTAGKTKKNLNLSAQAQYWKGLALMKVGSKIKIPKRQFIGGGPQVTLLIENVAKEHMKELNDYMKNLLKPK